MVDDQTFQVTLKEPSASFLNGAVVAMVASIVSQDAVEANGGVDGRPAERVHGDQHGRHRSLQVQHLEPRPRTSRSTSTRIIGARRRKLDVRIEIGSDPDVRVLGLLAGEFDIIETDASFVADLEGAEGVTLYKEGLLLEPLHIGFNLNIAEGSLPPEDTIPADFFHDPRVRQAFNYAFDYEAFLNGPADGLRRLQPALHPAGHLRLRSDAPRSTTSRISPRPRQLFREAGYWDEGFTVSLITEEANLFAAAGPGAEGFAGEAQPEVPW